MSTCLEVTFLHDSKEVGKTEADKRQRYELMVSD